MKFKFRSRCLCCNKENLVKIIDLGLHSFADRFVPKKKLNIKDPKYPLILDLCNHCKFIQSRTVTNPKNRYLEIDYSYTSSNSSYSRNHWIEFANTLEKKTKLKGKKIIEIGSNDGFLSHLLKIKGADVLGVDASEFMVKESQKKIKAIQSIFNYNQSKKIKKIFGEADIIIANNVFNHSDKPLDFLKGVYNLLDRDSIFIFEQPNFTVGVLSLKFDQIYHEHVSYFTARNIKSILDYSNLKILSLAKNEYHGGSLRTIATKKDSKLKEIKINEFINFENKKNIYKLSFYKKMMRKINVKKIKLFDTLLDLVSKGYVISGIGAAAKSNTFLTYYGLNNDIINFITDASKFKQKKYTPVTRIVIKDDKELIKYSKIACIILSWNISNLVINKIKKLNKKIKIIYT
jgi:2-polyprenyl-3-methyl-5-hydroxy-6-metoxy-1,4-benzoquinol methylase|tara:strand:- start:584 stop:1795 length:1212 start_codon:yes stop_codon:yes gene_type:complete